MIQLLITLIYLAFISLGLPDSVLGSAWPTISNEFNAPLSNMGIITMIIAAGTIISSLQSERLLKKLGIHTVCVGSIAFTAIALLGFSFSTSFIMLCLFAIPYGLGAGSIDAALNNYVAINFESKHMSWLHCMWGVGATAGPYIMGFTLTHGGTWNFGYQILFGIQIVLAFVIFVSRPIWNTKAISYASTEEEPISDEVLPLKEVVTVAGVPQIMITFFCFCAIEHTTGFWASSYLVLNHGVTTEIAATYASIFYLGITIGRFICGFIAMKFNDTQMIRCGEIIMLIGTIILLLPFGSTVALIGLITIGLGSAPVFPCIIHSTPANFGVKYSQAVTGIQMASAYTGILIMPAIFGVIANNISIKLYPIYLITILVIMACMYELVLKKVRTKKISH